MTSSSTRTEQKPVQFQVGGSRYDARSQAFASAIAQAYTNLERPRCLCRPAGIEMYVARRGEGHVVKRMPGTGSCHTPDCPSFEPPADASGLGHLLGSAIREDERTGRTTLRLDFALTKRPAQPARQWCVPATGSAARSAPRLSLKSLLHYLWDQAQLTRWHPAFQGRRNWPTVRWHLLQAAEGMLASTSSLSDVLYLPEAFSVDKQLEIDARRTAAWRTATEHIGGHQQLLLLIGEAKRIEPARHGHRMLIKHIPDAAFWLDEGLFGALTRRFGPELSLWGASDAVRMMTAATFAISPAGLPRVAELCLMPVTHQWLPIESFQELRLIARLVAGGRAFVKTLRYNLSRSERIASVALTDRGSTPRLVFLDGGGG